MASLKQQYWVVICFSLMSLLLAGCGTTPPSRYYMLNSIPQVSTESSPDQLEANVHVGIGPVTLPKYLDRYAIVIRSEGAEVMINDMHLWAEPLADNFTRVLANNINLLVSAADTSIYPWQNQNTIDYQVTVDVLRFDADINNNVILSAHWTIYGKDNNHPLYVGKTLIREKAGNNNYESLVSTQSEATIKLSQEIGDKLKEMIAQGN
ncbi:PqiC family protein [Kaarinaea lacus]